MSNQLSVNKSNSNNSSVKITNNELFEGQVPPLHSVGAESRSTFNDATASSNMEYQKVVQWLSSIGVLLESTSLITSEDINNAHEDNNSQKNDSSCKVGINNVADATSCYTSTSNTHFSYQYHEIKKFYVEQRLSFATISKQFICSKSGSCKLLFIDMFIAKECGGSQLRDEWLKKNGDGLYPPATIECLLKVLFLADVSYDNKFGLLLYFFQDLMVQNYKPPHDFIDRFLLEFKLKAEFVQTVISFWNLDKELFSLAVDTFLKIPSHSMHKFTDTWQQKMLLEALITKGESHLTIRILKSNILKVDPFQKLKILILNDMHMEAHHFARNCNEVQLLKYFFECCLMNRNCNSILSKLSFSDRENELFLNVLKNQKEKTDHDVCKLDLLKNSKYMAPIEYMEEVTKNNMFLNAVNKTIPPVIVNIFDAYKQNQHECSQNKAEVAPQSEELEPFSAHLNRNNISSLGGVLAALDKHKEKLDNFTNPIKMPFLQIPQEKLISKNEIKHIKTLSIQTSKENENNSNEIKCESINELKKKDSKQLKFYSNLNLIKNSSINDAKMPNKMPIEIPNITPHQTALSTLNDGDISENDFSNLLIQKPIYSQHLTYDFSAAQTVASATSLNDFRNSSILNGTAYEFVEPQADPNYTCITNKNVQLFIGSKTTATYKTQPNGEEEIASNFNTTLHSTTTTPREGDLVVNNNETSTRALEYTSLTYNFSAPQTVATGTFFNDLLNNSILNGTAYEFAEPQAIENNTAFEDTHSQKNVQLFIASKTSSEILEKVTELEEANDEENGNRKKEKQKDGETKQELEVKELKPLTTKTNNSLIVSLTLKKLSNALKEATKNIVLNNSDENLQSDDSQTLKKESIIREAKRSGPYDDGINYENKVNDIKKLNEFVEVKDKNSEVDEVRKSEEPSNTADVKNYSQEKALNEATIEKINKQEEEEEEEAEELLNVMNIENINKKDEVVPNIGSQEKVNQVEEQVTDAANKEYINQEQKEEEFSNTASKEKENQKKSLNEVNKQLSKFNEMQGSVHKLALNTIDSPSFNTRSKIKEQKKSSVESLISSPRSQRKNSSAELYTLWARGLNEKSSVESCTSSARRQKKIISAEPYNLRSGGLRDESSVRSFTSSARELEKENSVKSSTSSARVNKNKTFVVPSTSNVTEEKIKKRGRPKKQR